MLIASNIKFLIFDCFVLRVLCKPSIYVPMVFGISSDGFWLQKASFARLWWGLAGLAGSLSICVLTRLALAKVGAYLAH